MLFKSGGRLLARDSGKAILRCLFGQMQLRSSLLLCTSIWHESEIAVPRLGNCECEARLLIGGGLTALLLAAWQGDYCFGGLSETSSRYDFLNGLQLPQKAISERSVSAGLLALRLLEELLEVLQGLEDIRHFHYALFRVQRLQEGKLLD